MMSIFKALGYRLQALLLTDAALDIEATLLSRQADRVATLLVEADQHDEHGCPVVAAELRRQAERLSLERPLASIRAAILPLPDNDWDQDIAIEAGPTPLPERTTTNGNGNGHGHDRRRRARLPRAAAERMD